MTSLDDYKVLGARAKACCLKTLVTIIRDKQPQWGKARKKPVVILDISCEKVVKILKKHFIRAHRDENIIVASYWEDGYPAFRPPISGAGRWKGDCFAVIGKGEFEVSLIRRTSQANIIVFIEDEIKESIDFIKHLEKLGNKTRLMLIAHFPKFRKWIKHEVNINDYSGGEVVIKIREK